MFSILSGDQRGESCLGSCPSCMEGNQEVPIWVTELSPGIHPVWRLVSSCKSSSTLLSSPSRRRIQCPSVNRTTQYGITRPLRTDRQYALLVTAASITLPTDDKSLNCLVTGEPGWCHRVDVYCDSGLEVFDPSLIVGNVVVERAFFLSVVATCRSFYAQVAVSVNPRGINSSKAHYAVLQIWSATSRLFAFTSDYFLTWLTVSSVAIRRFSNVLGRTSQPICQLHTRHFLPYIGSKSFAVYRLTLEKRAKGRCCECTSMEYSSHL